ncbi:MAG TPA: acyl-CoA desaturase [Polyangia bacterium]|jgi:fatty acid desaturase
MLQLSTDNLHAFRAELDALRTAATARLGAADGDHIRGTARVSRLCELLGRVLIHASLEPLSWSTGVLLLAAHNVLDNMELGHNVLHGQYDWMRDPKFASKTYRWDFAVDEAQWRDEHNGLHHRYTNIRGQDPDLGYGGFRMTAEDAWSPLHVAQIAGVAATFLAFDASIGLFVTGILTSARAAAGPGWLRSAVRRLRPFVRKSVPLACKNYLLYPAAGGVLAPKILLGNLLAAVIRNVFAASVIYCGHFTARAHTFSAEEAAEHGTDSWYLRQVLGSSDFEGSQLLSLMSGHLNYQIEHHLFPHLPAWRYRELAPQVRAICEKHDVPYNTGSFGAQFTGVVKRILRHSLPA